MRIHTHTHIHTHAHTHGHRQVLTADFFRRNFGVLVCVGALYVAFLVALIFARYRRAKDSFEYIT
jgi:hypothetical protein